MRYSALVVLLLVLATPVSASMYLHVVGDVQGHIEGNALFSEEVNNIDLVGFDHAITVDYDLSTGLPIRNPQHHPLVVYKDWDSSTIGLMQALTTGENLQNVELRLWVLGSEPIRYYTIVLSDAKLVSMNQAGSPSENPTEAWGFTYREITWVDHITDRSTTDTWLGGLSAIDLNGGTHKLPLGMPRPNPTSSKTMLSFELPLETEASLDVYDVRGRLVRSLFWGFTTNKQMAVSWDGRDDDGTEVAKGMYIVRLKWPAGEVTRRVTLVN